MKVATILGTRPEIIKLSPLLPLFDKAFNHILIHTGQHYDYEMDALFFEELRLKKPKYNLQVGSGRQGKQTAIMLDRIECLLLKEKVDLVIVLGDTNTVLAGALVASKLGITLAHVESGCRSYNRSMPEEINRVITDHVANILFAPDKKAEACLLREGIPKKKIFLTGSTAFDACMRNKQFIAQAHIMQQLGLAKNRFILVTLHRAGNTNDIKRLRSIVKALNILGKDIDIVFPIHPRTLKIIKANKIKLSKNIKVIPPQGYINFLQLMDGARVIISDSGGIQEESLVFNTPCLIPREDSEWMRLVEAGKNFLIGGKTKEIVRQTRAFIKDDRLLKKVKAITYGFDTGVSQKIVRILKKR